MFTPQDSDLLAGQQEGYKALEANTGTQSRDVQRLMERYGASNADYLAKMKEAQLGGEGAAKLRLDARLAESQLRSRIHEYKLNLLKQAYKDQERQNRNAMYAALIGSVGTVAQGVLAPKSQQSNELSFGEQMERARIANTPYILPPQYSQQQTGGFDYNFQY